ncbi:hypothetical protein DTO164E3_276 [Paecilomyces variotii]|nr:hypothetical protein DTO032I3_2996 [Paecilomyces variotii]KAJ9207990.1 hypothetical protein DTO164E3_276 [Paecilomyces variotii]KAJ9280590.1 hypothetical protein DTO021D3_2440 [Paecilomyces variotii]KAJ9323110.1 hypothetical protein DTO027B3_5904 [Paecilomyces variotii]KAJ9346201.1 hypothetical protein DTO027B6_1054 [Paecilomyces variotii]
MQFTEEEAADVKKWVVKRLEDISDADSDVLADYVLALIRSDAPDEEIRKASVENLEDFLREHTVKFVDEIFEKFGPKQQQQAAPATAPNQFPVQSVSVATPSAPSIQQQQDPFNAPLGAPKGPFGGPMGSVPTQPAGFDGANYSRKRTFNEGFQADQGPGEQQFHSRVYKTPRRGRGRGDRMGGPGRDGRPGGPPGSQFPAPGGFPGMPAGFPPFDPNDPMGAMLALQNMGFPPMPGMPPLPQQQGNLAGKSTERCPLYDTQGICYLGATCPYQHGDSVVPPRDDEYDPTNANIMIDVQRDGEGAGRGFERGRGRGRGRGDRGGFAGRGRGRAEFSMTGPNEDRSVTTIVVEQIPEDKFNEESIREFFSQFGNIVEVTLQAPRHLALVKYDTYESAKAAWSSPKVIFDNRFVKVYWYKPRGKPDANGGQRHTSSTPMDTEADATPFDKEEFERQQLEAQKAHEERMKKLKETEEARQALEKQREELLRKQQEEKARLLERLKEKGALNGAEELNGDKAESPADENVSEQTKQLRAQLAALEAEAKSLGIDPNNPQPSTSFRGRGRGAPYRGRGGFPPRGRGYDPSFRGGFRGRGAFRGRGGVLRLDNRPKRVAVSGVEFDSSKDEALRQYLIGIGEYQSVDPNPERSDSQIITFKDRYVAEKLMYGPTTIPGVGNVEMSWIANPAPTPSATGGPGPDGKTRDEDSVMENTGEAAPEPDSTRRDGNHEVDYDVAEVDDSWGIE